MKRAKWAGPVSPPADTRVNSPGCARSDKPFIISLSQPSAVIDRFSIALRESRQPAVVWARRVVMADDSSVRMQWADSWATFPWQLVDLLILRYLPTGHFSPSLQISSNVWPLLRNQDSSSVLEVPEKSGTQCFPSSRGISVVPVKSSCAANKHTNKQVWQLDYAYLLHDINTTLWSKRQAEWQQRYLAFTHSHTSIIDTGISDWLTATFHIKPSPVFSPCTSRSSTLLMISRSCQISSCHGAGRPSSHVSSTRVGWLTSRCVCVCVCGEVVECNRQVSSSVCSAVLISNQS